MSLKNMTVCDIVESSNFVKSATDQVINKIEESNSRKIILAGPRGSGKSVTLCAYEKLRSIRDAIYMSFDSNAHIEKLPNDLLMYYYELAISNNILNFIKKNYKEKFMESFLELDCYIIDILKRFKYYINNPSGISAPYVLVSQGYFVNLILSKVKDNLDVNSLTLLIDHFDWLGNSNEKFQNVIANYFDMNELFNKSIITTDDPEVYLNAERQNPLANKGYKVISVDYAKDLETVKSIISADINYYNNQQGFKYVDIKELISEKTYDELITRANGNLKLLFSILYDFYSYGEIAGKVSDIKIKLFFEKAINTKTNGIINTKKLHL
jgi:DNA polymerase III delta prime subunit